MALEPQTPLVIPRPSLKVRWSVGWKGLEDRPDRLEEGAELASVLDVLWLMW